MAGIEFSRILVSFGDFVELKPDSSLLIAAFGKKGSGKSTWCRSFYTSFDGDKLAVDVNGDIGPGDNAVEIFNPLPDFFPTDPDGYAQNLHYRADPGSPTYREDLDNAIKMGLFPKENHVLLWLDEIGEFTSGNRTDPAMRRLLMQSRHYNCSAIFGGPRPIDVDKLVISQSDIIGIFDLPDPDDQAKIAKIIAYPIQRFAAAVAEMRALGPHHHLVYASSKVTRSGRAELALCDPVTID